MHCDPRVNTMLELLAYQANEHGPNTACLYLNDQGQQTGFTYSELELRARAIAAQLQQQMEPGQRALLVYPAGLDFIAAFFGCLYAGVVAVPATYPKPRRPLPRMNRIAADCAAHVALTTSQTLATIDRSQVDADVGQLDWIATDVIDQTTAESWHEPKVDGQTLAFLQYTSGSTSDPKGVMVSHGNLVSNLAAIRQAFGIGEVEVDRVASTGVFWLPAYHDMGLIGGILTPLYVGGRSVLMSPASFLQRPIRWLRAIHKYQATISGAPNFAYELSVNRTTPEERAGLDLSMWRLAFCGAEPIRAETIEHFTQTYRQAGFRSSALYPCYGLAESTLLVAGPRFDDEPIIRAFNRQALAEHRVMPAGEEPKEQLQRLVSCGKAVPRHELIVVHPETNTLCGRDSVGEIMVAGPSVTQGYWNCAEETNQVFRARVANSDRRYLRTGDLGFVHDGQLYVTGRLKDVIIVRGRNHYPQDIEQTVEEAHAAIMPGAAFTVPVNDEERLVVVHQVDRQYRDEDWEQAAAAVRRAISLNHELDPHAVVFIRQTSLPVTSSGKVQRNLCRQQYLDGMLKVVHQWSRRKTSDCPDSASNGRHVRGTAAANGRQTPRGNGQVEVQIDQSGVHWNQNRGGVETAPIVPGRAAQKPAVKPTATNQQFNGMHVDRAAERIESWMLHWLVERVGLDSADVERNRPFAEFGVDSLTAVELSQELEDEFGVELTPIVAWNYPTPAALSRYLAEAATTALALPTSDPPADGMSATMQTPHFDTHDGELQKLLAEVESLSDEEAARMLAEEA